MLRHLKEKNIMSALQMFQQDLSGWPFMNVQIFVTIALMNL